MLNLVAGLLILPASVVKVCLSIIMAVPEMVLHRFREDPPVWWLYDVKDRNWVAQKFPKWYWYGIRNTLPWLRLPFFEIKYTKQDPRFVNIESIYLRDAGQPQGWRFTRYKWLLAEWEFVRANDSTYNEYRFGWATEGRKLKLTTQIRRNREYGK